MICIGGFNVFPAEIESHLAKIEGIVDTCVIGIENGGANHLVAFIITKTNDVTRLAIISHCAKLANYKVPSKIFFVDRFPLTGSGKKNKKELLASYIENKVCQIKKPSKRK